MCEASHARFLDTAVEPTGRWTSLRKVITHLTSLDPAIFPVVLIAVSSLYCQQGCCIVSFFVRPGDTDGWVLQQMLSEEHGYGFLRQLTWTPNTILDAGEQTRFPSPVFTARCACTYRFDMIACHAPCMNGKAQQLCMHYTQHTNQSSICLLVKPYPACAHASPFRLQACQPVHRICSWKSLVIIMYIMHACSL